MGFAECLRLAFEGLRANKMRSVLTMLGIIIGIAAVIAILTVGDSLSGAITGEMSSLGASSITISLQEKGSLLGGMGRRATLSEEDYLTDDMIAAMREKYADDIAGIAITQSAGSGQAKDGRLYANVSLSGVNDEYFSVNELNLLAGRFLREKDEDGQRMICVVSNRLVNNLFGGDVNAALGSPIAVTVGKEVWRLRIIGVYEYVASNYMISFASAKDTTTSVYIPVSTAKHLTSAPAGYSSFTVQAKDGTDSAVVGTKLKNFLNRYYKHNDRYQVFFLSMDSIIESVNTVMDTISIAISVIAAISLLVGGIGVMNIMLVSVTERTREIGTRKALGATNGDIRLQFVVESVIICLVGGVIGMLLGGVMGYVGSYLLKSPTLPGIGAIALAFGFSLAVGVFFGYYPANKAAKLDPIEALRYE